MFLPQVRRQRDGWVTLDITDIIPSAFMHFIYCVFHRVVVVTVIPSHPTVSDTKGTRFMSGQIAVFLLRTKLLYARAQHDVLQLADLKNIYIQFSDIYGIYTSHS